MELIHTILKALLDISRVEVSAGENDAAYRKQIRIILNSPSVQYALARARDAPQLLTEAPVPEKTAHKRTPKPKEVNKA